MKFYSKIIFCSENLFYYWFETLCWLLEEFRNLFELFWIKFAKAWNKSENRKRKWKRIKEKKKGCGGHFRPSLRRSPRPNIAWTPNRYAPLSPPDADTPAPLVSTITKLGPDSSLRTAPLLALWSKYARTLPPSASLPPPIKGPRPPLSSPFVPRLESQQRRWNSSSEIRSTCELLRSNLSPTVSQTSLFLLYPLYLKPANLPNLLTSFYPHQIDALDQDRSAPAPAPAPAALPLFCMKQSRTAVSPTWSPHPAEHRPPLPCLRNSLVHHRSLFPSRRPRRRWPLKP
jgi:hypothetical protein